MDSNPRFLALCINHYTTSPTHDIHTCTRVCIAKINNFIPTKFEMHTLRTFFPTRARINLDWMVKILLLKFENTLYRNPFTKQ